MSAPPTATPPPGEGCPTPLAWEQVLATFRDERDEFELRTSWGNVSVWEYGTGSPLVFIGGPGGRGDLFALTCYLLRDDYRSIIIQLPNAPRRVPVEQRPAGWGHLVQQAIGARQHGRVPLFAADWGARVALQLAIDAPDSLHSLDPAGMSAGCLVVVGRAAADGSVRRIVT
ncbi:MAG: alpha/beta hydrolase [Planctomycetaceae bacterium]